MPKKKKMPQQPPHSHPQKTPQQIAQEFQQQEKVKKFRQKVKQEIYPLLLSESENIEDAKMMLSVVGMTIKQSLMNKEREIKVKDLEFPKVEEKFKRFDSLLSILKEESAFDAFELCEGMKGAIDSFIKEENTKRKLDVLPAQLLD